VVFEQAIGGEPFAFAHDSTDASIAALVTDAEGNDAVVAIDVTDPDAPEVLPPIEAIYGGSPANLRYGLLGVTDGEAVMQSANQLMSWYTLDLADPEAELAWLAVRGPWHHDPFVVAYDGGRAAAG
jgi:hypothetical protein